MKTATSLKTNDTSPVSGQTLSIIVRQNCGVIIGSFEEEFAWLGVVSEVWALIRESDMLPENTLMCEISLELTHKMRYIEL